MQVPSINMSQPELISHFGKTIKGPEDFIKEESSKSFDKAETEMAKIDKKETEMTKIENIQIQPHFTLDLESNWFCVRNLTSEKTDPAEATKEVFAILKGNQ